MRNGGTAAMAAEAPDEDVEKQENGTAVEGGGGTAGNAVVGQPQDSAEKVIEVVVVDCANKGVSQLERDSNSHEECSDQESTCICYSVRETIKCGGRLHLKQQLQKLKVCQEEKEEALINLGCLCRGGLAKAHHSCIVKWFNTRGSNKCEICQQVAANVLPPDPQTSYWVWTVDPAYRTQDRQRGCFSPLWVAFSILVGGLLLDVLISVTLGVSALPVNIIIGVIVVLGLGTALRLGLEFCQEWNVRRVVQRVEANATIGYHPAL